MTGIDFSWLLQGVQQGFAPMFGPDFPVGIIALMFVAAFCIFGHAGLVLTAGALFVCTFILTYMGFLPAVAYIVLVLIAGASLAYLLVVKPNQ